ncbi:MAG: ABC transporter ATP-binding protein [Deltaproteobacteria bacterium]|nr:ABC transporter ATP-binding protein [Deltaproteobacteria bacterium]MBW1812944.1 ABC transporter ATP-binding protein [Deltaproteobacteria bacterium]MBW1847449.1 ABC transporter ATP-binding protein [Deltaproteobacteria bacterium]MBW1984946.1 ABC transporter ATP-binding protein [Deltaproteobacteria bacterium]MBW2179141.1 ABC transporter ATP-binding protein [Deltaproteobacteria bacterium]
MLELKNIWVYYDKNPAVRNLSLTVNKGDFITILGANGAGKSTTLNAISGIAKVKKGKGEIYFKGKKINGLKPPKIAAMGIIQVPEGRKLWPLLTVQENLKLGAYLQKDKQKIKQNMEKVLTLFPDLKDKLYAKGRMLSGGQQQMAAIARGLMANPEVLLFDEPSLGLSPILRQHLAEIIKEISKEGTTVVLVEQNARLGLMLATYGYVIENGELTLQGKTSDLLNDENVKKAYLGV